MLGLFLCSGVWLCSALRVKADAHPDAWLHARAMVTPTPRQAAAPAACTDILGQFANCLSMTPGISTMSASDQASCLCYVSGTNVGPTFDYDVAACISTASAMGDTSLLSDFEGITSFCADFAPVTTVPANPSPASSSSSNPPIITPAPSTNGGGSSGGGSGGGNLADCSPFWSLLTSCNNESPGFTNFDVTTQAACLCYSNSVWVPNNFDNAASACATAASIIGSVQIASDASVLDSFCGQIGPVTLTTSGGSSTSSMPSITTPRPGPTTMTTIKNAAVPRATNLAQVEVILPAIGAAAGLFLLL